MKATAEKAKIIQSDIAGNNTLNQSALLYSFDNNSTLNNQGFSINDTVTLEFDWSATNPASGSFILQWQGDPWGFNVPTINLSSTNGSGHVIHTFNIRDIDINSTVVAGAIGYRLDNIPANTVITFSNVIISKAKTSQPWMPSSSEVTNDDYPKYIGYSNTVKTNKVANDYKWFATIDSHASDKSNPHAVTAEQVNAYTKTVTFTKTEIQDLLSEAIKQSKLDANPIGTIITTTNSTNPSIYLGGIWERYGQGQVLVGVDENDADFNETGKTGGEKAHSLTEAENGKHSHSYTYANVNNVVKVEPSQTFGCTAAINGSTGSSGDGKPHNNLQPYVAVYMWRRTA